MSLFRIYKGIDFAVLSTVFRKRNQAFSVPEISLQISLRVMRLFNDITGDLL